MIVEGHPAEVRAVNAIGMLRSDFSQTDVDAMKEAFRLLFKHAAPVAEALPELRNKYPDHVAIARLCDAVEASAMGVHGRAREAPSSRQQVGHEAACCCKALKQDYFSAVTTALPENDAAGR